MIANLSKENGDGYIQCDDGHLHWGLYGAAGILLRYHDRVEDLFYLVRRRASVNQGIGSCYGIPGGATNMNESPWDSALREWDEEVHTVYPISYEKTIHHNDHGNWSYTTFLANTSNNQHMCVKNRYEHKFGVWASKEQIDLLSKDRQLHPGFEDTWKLCRDYL